MTNLNDSEAVVKDEENARPVPGAWRRTFQAIVDAFSRGDYSLTGGIPAVAPVSAATAAQVERFIASYGETLASLPEETWDTSIVQWMHSFWEVLVDLWTYESGASDMVLSVRVFEDEGNYRFEIVSVHVP
jgi:hypothetical protein